jgi:hypothetical protein
MYKVLDKDIIEDDNLLEILQLYSLYDYTF